MQLPRLARVKSGLGGALALMLLAGCATVNSGSGKGASGQPIALTQLTAALESEMSAIGAQLTALASFHKENGGDAGALATHAAALLGSKPVSLYEVAADGATATLHDSGRFGEEQPPLQVAHARAGKATFAPAITAPEGVVTDAAIAVHGGALVARVLVSELAARTVDAQLGGTHIDAWIMETSGLQVYDADPEEIGLNLATDPLYDAYPDLQALIQDMQNQEHGAGVYTFLATGFDSLVDKRATWATARFGERAWRVVVVELVSGKTGEVLGLPQDLDVMWDVRAIKTLITTPAWQTAFVNADEATLRQEFQLVLREHDLIYSMACIYPDGVIRFGEPPASSFHDYDLAAGRIDRDAALLGAARSPGDSWHVFELVEGGRGLFYVLPVSIGGEQAGAIYGIWLLPAKE
jgi:hypothetical protein